MQEECAAAGMVRMSNRDETIKMIVEECEELRVKWFNEYGLDVPSEVFYNMIADFFEFASR